MPKTKKPTLYYDFENPMEISFEKKPGFKRVTSASPVDFAGFLLDNTQQVLGASRVIAATLDIYCVAWDGPAGALAYTSRQVEGQNWQDLRAK